MNEVHAVIEMKITPQRECGFGRIAERVAKFDQVEACFLMSGGYDLLVFVKGESLQDVAHFVAADLSTLDFSDTNGVSVVVSLRDGPRRVSAADLVRPDAP